MTAAVQQWITGVAAAAVIGALAQSLIPEGGAKNAGRLAAGLLLLLAVVKPVAGLDTAALAGALADYQLGQAGDTAALAEENEALVKAIIEERTCAYISDKAQELGIACTVRVTYHYGADGAVWPESAVVTGELTWEERSRVARLLETELAIPPENQTFERVAGQ